MQFSLIHSVPNCLHQSIWSAISHDKTVITRVCVCVYYHAWESIKYTTWMSPKICLYIWISLNFIYLGNIIAHLQQRHMIRDRWLTFTLILLLLLSVFFIFPLGWPNLHNICLVCVQYVLFIWNCIWCSLHFFVVFSFELKWYKVHCTLYGMKYNAHSLLFSM